MRSNSNERPSVITYLGNGEYQFAYNVIESTTDDRTSFNYDVVIIRDAKYDDIVSAIISAIIKEKYSQDEREAAIRKGISDPNNEDYVSFNTYAEETKALVKELLK